MPPQIALTAGFGGYETNPAIITSGTITDNVREDAKKLGIIALYEKPVEMDELKQAAMNLFQNENYDKTHGMQGKLNDRL